MSEQKTEVRTTAADIKKQIEQAKEDLKNSSLPISGQLANEINASESTPKATNQVEVKPEPATAAKGMETPTGADPGLKDWAKKKGIDWTTDESVLRALQLSDKQFHEKRQKEKSQEQTQQPNHGYVPPVYAPAPQVYAPPPINNRSIIENIARDYKLTLEDAEKLLMFNRDFYQAASREDRERYQKEIDEIKRAEQKNSAFRELSLDPALKNPDVAAEFSRLLEETQNRDPQSFEQDPMAYIKVRDNALINVYRRNLEGFQLQEGTPPMAKPPTVPPKSLGKGSGGGALEDESGFDRDAFFKLKTPQEKKAYLEKMGLVSTY